MKLGAKTGCHQLHERSFSIKGYQFPLCARCTGLFIGQTCGLIFSFFYIKYDIKYLFLFALIFFVLLGIDGFGQYINLWVSTNLRRFLTGITCGYFVTIFIINIIIKAIEIIKTKINI
ncbi:hypothetical protein R84B8_02094 [Treponema sp. R8-4-B8]